MWGGVEQRGMVWNSMGQRGMVWDGMGCCGMAWDGVGRHGTVWDGMGCCGMAWDGVGWHGMVWDGVGRCGTSWPTGMAPHRTEKRRAKPGAAGAILAGWDTCYRAEQVLVKTQTPTRQKNPSATSSFTGKSIFLSLQMFNILIKVLRFSFLSDLTLAT